MFVLVTENQDFSNSNYQTETFDEFFEQTHGEGLTVLDGIFFDLPYMEEGDYEAIEDGLCEAGILYGFTSTTGTVPPWFEGEYTPIEEEKMSQEDALELARSFDMIDYDEESEYEQDSEPGVGKIIVFGSSKGGSGKTFTSLIDARAYARDHPDKKVCILDLDIEEPQMSIVVRQLGKNLKGFYTAYCMGRTSFEELYKCRYTDPDKFSPNLDFYLTPRDSHPVQDEAFWQCVLTNLFCNYDMVFLDTGTTYMETPAIATAYKVADKVNIVSMANIASTVTVGQQIRRLTGITKNDIYSVEDGIADKINIIITNMFDDDVCRSIKDRLDHEAPVIATFGNLSREINEIEVLGRWNYYDDDPIFHESLVNMYTL